MIICPPNAAPVQPPESAGWYYTNSKWGTQVRKKTQMTRNGLNAWAIPASTLAGKTLYQVDQQAMTATAHLWVAKGPAIQASYTSNAAAFPYTNRKNKFGARNGFSLWMHQWLFANRYTLQDALEGTYPWTPWPGSYFDAEWQENHWPLPAITDAALNTTGGWHVTVSNAATLASYYTNFFLMLSAPGQNTLPFRTPFMVGRAHLDTATGKFTDPGPGYAADRLKPFPAYSDCLIGIHPYAYPNNGLQPYLSAVGITVDP